MKTFISFGGPALACSDMTKAYCPASLMAMLSKHTACFQSTNGRGLALSDSPEVRIHPSRFET